MTDVSEDLIQEYRRLLRENGFAVQLPKGSWKKLCAWCATSGDVWLSRAVSFGRFAGPGGDLLILPPSPETADHVRGAFVRADLRGKARHALEEIAKVVVPGFAAPYPSSEEVQRLGASGRPVWDGMAGRWINVEALCPKTEFKNGSWYADKKDLEAFKKSSVVTTPPGSYPPKSFHKIPPFSPKGVPVHYAAPGRFTTGQWGVAQGDIDAAYSAQSFESDKGAAGVKTFEFDGRTWTTVALTSVGPFTVQAEAFEVVAGKGKPFKPGKGYEGVEVSVRGKRMRLGKKAYFRPEA